MRAMSKRLLAVLLFMLLSITAPARMLLQPDAAEVEGSSTDAVSIPAAMMTEAPVAAVTAAPVDASATAATTTAPAEEAGAAGEIEAVGMNDLGAAVVPASDEAAAAATTVPPSLMPATIEDEMQAATAGVATPAASVQVAIEDTYSCFCKPGDAIWGCPFFPYADLKNSVDTILGCLGRQNPKRTCGSVRNAACSTTLVANQLVLTDFNVTYKMKKACPGCCTAFGIHSGGIDKGVDDILEGLAACSNINWGIYKFRAPTSYLHVTEVQFNEPCYGVLRTMPLPAGKKRARIHVHSFGGSNNVWTVCVGASTSAADTFIEKMRAALQARGVFYVAVEKKGVRDCSDSPGKEGRDELSLEIKRGLALKMAAEAKNCGRDAPAMSAFLALVDALKETFPGCTSPNQAYVTTSLWPGCAVGCDGVRNCWKMVMP